ncbi:hypothetical protein EG834_19230, partial [bacterium]|nr:hypothetical protein [bacterium]
MKKLILTIVCMIAMASVICTPRTSWGCPPSTPVISNWDASTFNENIVNADYQILDTDASVSSLVRYTELSVNYTSNNGTQDHLTIKHEGTGSGQIGVSGSTITYGGSQIGTMSGGASGTTLVVSLNTTDNSAVTALMRRISYKNT